MKTSDFIIFISIVLGVYLSVNYYIFARINQALPQIGWVKTTFYILFGFLVSAYIIHVFLVRMYPSTICTIFSWTGSMWFSVMMYGFIAVLLIDLLRAVNHFIPFIPQSFYMNYEKTKLLTLISATSIILITIIAGFINAANPQLKTLNLKIDKATNINKLRIVAASDIHIGSIITRSRVEKLVERINELEPDIVLLPGDILDESIEPVIKFKSGEPLKNIKSKYGVYAITGNHEYIGGIHESVPYLETLGIKILRDTTVLINNSFYIVGREDISGNRFSNVKRKPLTNLMAEVEYSKPVILLDHQPFKLHESQENNIDLQLSGHTHHGQMFPANIVTNLMYELSWGYLKKGNTHYYVSSGYGTWGPPVRVGNRPELLLINLEFGR